MNETANQKQRAKWKLHLVSAIPVFLIIVLSFSFDKRNVDSALSVLFGGALLLCVICPLYYMILCWHHTIKINMIYESCATVCFVMNVLANVIFIIIVSIVSITIKAQTLIILAISIFILSMILTGCCLFIVKMIKRKQDAIK